MKNAVAAFLAAACLLGSAQAWARVGIYLSLPAPVVVAPAPPPVVVMPPPPPPPPPVVVAPPPPVVQYQYYPAWNMYLDPASGMYWYPQGGTWVLGPLPPYVHGRLGRVVVVPGEPGRPWHRVPPGHYYRHW